MVRRATLAFCHSFDLIVGACEMPLAPAPLYSHSTLTYIGFGRGFSEGWQDK